MWQIFQCVKEDLWTMLDGRDSPVLSNIYYFFEIISAIWKSYCRYYLKNNICQKGHSAFCFVAPRLCFLYDQSFLEKKVLFQIDESKYSHIIFLFILVFFALELRFLTHIRMCFPIFSQIRMLINVNLWSFVVLH